MITTTIEAAEKPQSGEKSAVVVSSSSSMKCAPLYVLDMSTVQELWVTTSHVKKGLGTRLVNHIYTTDNLPQLKVSHFQLFDCNFIISMSTIVCCFNMRLPHNLIL